MNNRKTNATFYNTSEVNLFMQLNELIMGLEQKKLALVGLKNQIDLRDQQLIKLQQRKQQLLQHFGKLQQIKSQEAKETLNMVHLKSGCEKNQIKNQVAKTICNKKCLAESELKASSDTEVNDIFSGAEDLKGDKTLQAIKVFLAQQAVEAARASIATGLEDVLCSKCIVEEARVAVESQAVKVSQARSRAKEEENCLKALAMRLECATRAAMLAEKTLEAKNARLLELEQLAKKAQEMADELQLKKTECCICGCACDCAASLRHKYVRGNIAEFSFNAQDKDYGNAHVAQRTNNVQSEDYNSNNGTKSMNYYENHSHEDKYKETASNNPAVKLRRGQRENTKFKRHNKPGLGRAATVAETDFKRKRDKQTFRGSMSNRGNNLGTFNNCATWFNDCNFGQCNMQQQNMCEIAVCCPLGEVEPFCNIRGGKNEDHLHVDRAKSAGKESRLVQEVTELNELPSRCEENDLKEACFEESEPSFLKAEKMPEEKHEESEEKILRSYNFVTCKDEKYALPSHCNQTLQKAETCKESKESNETENTAYSVKSSDESSNENQLEIEKEDGQNFVAYASESDTETSREKLLRESSHAKEAKNQKNDGNKHSYQNEQEQESLNKDTNSN